MSEPSARPSEIISLSDIVWPKYRYLPLGDGALTVECGNVIDYRLGAISTSLARRIQRDGFPGFIEAVPAFASVTIYYETATVRKAFPDHSTAFDAVKSLAADLIEQLICVGDPDAAEVEIPVLIDKFSSPDLERVASLAGLSADDVVEIFIFGTYRVYMLGFLPGFAYMGDVDDRIAAPRLAMPRTTVPKGSVGIAGRQTGIYPLESPGGWNIIGQTDLTMFDASSADPCLLKPGDRVRFLRI